MANVLQTSYMLDTTLREKRCNVELSVWTQITMLPLTQFSNKCELLQVNFSVKLAEPLVSILRQFQMPSTPLKKIESGHMIDTLQMQQFLLRTLLKKSNLNSSLIQFLDSVPLIESDNLQENEEFACILKFLKRFELSCRYQ